MFDSKSITYKEEYSISCCKENFVSAWKFEVLDWLFCHIKKEHKDFYLTLQQEGRKSAMSQNGCGYFDDGKSKGPKSAWAQAEPGFKQAHMQKALARAIGTWT